MRGLFSPWVARRCNVLSLLLIGAMSTTMAQEFAISGFTFKYGNPRAGLPELTALASVEINLGREGGTWTEPSDRSSQQILIRSLPSDSVFDGKGLNALMAQLVRYYKDQGIMAVYIVPTEGQINARNGRDMRRDSKQLELTVWIGKVAETRTVARGYRFLDKETINLPQHQRIVQNAPLGDAGGVESGMLLQEPITEYLMRLNTHPGRRVDMSISAGENPGDLVVDMLVNEQKPWFVYAQVSNTGPESTGEWRARTGFIHYQLTNSDDILTTDFISDFQDTMAATFSYSRPLIYPDNLSFRVRGSWTDFTAAELAEGTVDYLGTTYSGGIELIYRPFIWRNISFQFIGGINYQNISVTSQTTEEGFIVTDGTADLIMPYLGANITRRERSYAYSAYMQFETNVSSIDATNLNSLGRVNVDEGSMILSTGGQASVYLEPLFLREKWGDPSSWENSRLAHELRFQINAQYGFSKRLLAQTELVLGGMDRVRGYPESVRAGDSGFNATIEYAYHIPRALKPAAVMRREAAESGREIPDVQSLFMGRYNMRPTDVFAMPDWDFVLKTFIDVGATYVNDADFNESDADLLSAGIGIDVQLSTLAALRLDWAYVLQALERGGVTEVDTGDNRLHVRVQVTW